MKQYVLGMHKVLGLILSTKKGIKPNQLNKCILNVHDRLLLLPTHWREYDVHSVWSAFLTY